MQDSNRVIVIGGGIGGLAAAASMRAAGVPVDVFERQPELRELGTGVGIQRVAAQALALLRLGDALRGISGPGLQALRLVSSKDGRKLAEIPWHGKVVTVHRGELLGILARGVGDLGVVHCGMECVGFRQDPAGVTALFVDGHEERGAVLVGADGLQSVIRKTVVGDGQPLYTAATVWRALPVFSHPSLAQSFAQQVYGSQRIFGMFPVDERLFWWGSEVRPRGAVDPPIGRKRDVLQTFDGWPGRACWGEVASLAVVGCSPPRKKSLVGYQITGVGRCARAQSGRDRRMRLLVRIDSDRQHLNRPRSLRSEADS